MNPSTKSRSWLITLMLLLTGLTFVFSLQAQETPNAGESLTAEATAPLVETTPEVEVTAEVTPEATETVLPVSSIEPITAFSEDFEAVLAQDWLLSGWQVVTTDDNSYLATDAPNSIASVTNYAQASFTLTARLNVSAGNVARFNLNGYSVMFDAFGNSRLYFGETLLDASIPQEVVPDQEPDWYSVQVDLLANVVNVWVDGTLSLSYIAEQPFLASIITFASGESNTATIALDDLSITKQEALFVPVPVVVTPTEEATSLPSPTEDVVLEVTEEVVEATDVVAETTEEATEIVAEATEEVASIVETPAPTFTTNFSEGTDGWATNGAIVDNGQGNHALLLASGSTINSTLSFTDFQLEIAFQLTGENAALVLSFADSTLAITATSATATQGETSFSNVLALGEGWHALSLTVREGVLTLLVDGQPALAGALTLTPSTLTLQSVGSVLLDNLALTDFAPVPVVAEAPAIARANLNGNLELLMGADATTHAEIANTFNLTLDAFGRVLVEIGLRADGESADLVAFVESNGGEIENVGSSIIRAYVIPLSLALIVEHPQAFAVRPATFAASTSTNNAPAGTEASQAFGLIGAHAWHQNGVTGTGVNIGIIDVGFGTGAATTLPSKAGEYSCLRSPVALRTGTATTSVHGRNMVELLCDLAPSSNVWLYQASDYDTLYTAVEQARTDNIDVLLITLDLGADAAPGDGAGRPTGNNPYTSLQSARNDGMVIIAAAGNSGNPADIGTATKAARYYAYSTNLDTSSATTLSVKVSRGDKISVSWNGWGDGGASQIAINLTGGSITAQNGIRIGANVAGSTVTVPNEGDCNTNPTCDLTLTLTPSGASTVVVQVQITPVQIASETQTANVRILSVTLGSSSSVVNGGSIARPADSPAVLAVGAVCTAQASNLALLPDSSVGPVYSLGGGVPSGGAATRATAKPDLVSFSVVRSFAIDDCNGTIAGLDNAEGFQGTSTAAAHVAGMVALLKSNSANTSMNGWNARNSTTAQAIEDYLQTRIAELPLGTTANGYDYIYGAGIPFLGDSRFNMANSYNPVSAPNQLNCSASTVYVGQGNANTTQAGTLANPFLTVPHALIGRATFDCIVVLPGEYFTPWYITSGMANRIVSYDSVTSADEGDSLIYVSAQYYNGDYEVAGFPATFEKVFPKRGGVYLDGAFSNTIQGFKFIYVPFHSYTGINAPQAIVIDDSETLVKGNWFGSSSANGLAVAGWNNQVSSVFLMFDTAYATIEENVFDGNMVDGQESSVVVIAGSGTTTPIRFINNNVTNNSNGGSATTDWASLFISEQSHTDIIANRFVNNGAGTIIMTRTKAQTDTEATRIVSNVFLDNEGYASGPTVSTGGLVNAFNNRYLYFVNNTVVNNDFSDSGTLNNALITRGHPGATNDGEITVGANQSVSIHNNLLKGNTFVNVLSYTNLPAPQCNATPGAGSVAVSHNWWEGAMTNISNTSYACNGVLRDGSGGINANLTGPVSDDQFIGAIASFQITDWRYYGLRLSSLAVDRGAAINAVGIPNNGSVFDSPFNLDASLRNRVRDEPSVTNHTSAIDIGAFEFAAININDGDTDGNANPSIFQITVNEDLTPSTTTPSETWITTTGGVLAIDLRELVEDAFGSVQIQLPTLALKPNNYGTQCAGSFTNGIRLGTGADAGKLFYCPPPNFHNNLISSHDHTNPDSASVIIGYNAVDEANNTISGHIVVRIVAQADVALGAGGFAIGDGTPAEDMIEATVPSDTTGVTLQARPYVSLGNFTFSEANNPEGTISQQVDYPFSYGTISAIAHFPGDVTGILNNLIIHPTTGVISFDTTSVRGRTTIRYRVTDANTNFVDNYIRINVTNFIPAEPGLYDDGSFAWTYIKGDPNSTFLGWTANVNTAAINNTTHASNGIGDKAEFSFVGTGFVLYMWGEFSGNIYDLFIDGNSIMGTWTLVSGAPFNQPVYTRVFTGGALDGWTCSARTAIGTGANAIYLSNYGTNQGYTVTCNNPAAPAAKHTVRLENKQSYGVMSVDAFSIINDQTAANGGPLPPGMHNVENPEIRAIFAGKANWQEQRLFSYTGGVAYVATGAPTADNISFTFTGGTGFAIGTVMDGYNATFKMCVRDTATNDDRCQWVDTSAKGTSTILAYKSYIPFYGLEQNATYEVTISDISIPLWFGTVYGRLVIDTIVVLPPSMSLNNVLGFGTTENSAFDKILYGTMEQGLWQHDLNHFAASEKSLTQTTFLGSAAGPFVAFKTPATANTLLFNFYHSSTQSTRWMFCVDRALLTATPNDYGNCIIVNTRPFGAEPSYYTIDPANGNFVAGVGSVQISNGTLLLTEANFPAAWGAGFDPDNIALNGDEYHIFEAFSLVNEQINFDKVTVYDTNAPMTAGVHEEFMPTFTYFDKDGNLVTPGIYNVTTNAFHNTTDKFLAVSGFNAFSDSAQSVVWTKEVGASISFTFTGTGFAPRFRTDYLSDEVEVCWRRTSDFAYTAPVNSLAEINDIRAGTCQTFEHESFTYLYRAEQQIVGLANDTYAVNIRMKPDNQNTNRFGAAINMWFDGAVVYNTNWFDNAQITPVNVGTTIEANFPQRETDKRLRFFGTDWLYYGLYYTTYSNNDYNVTFSGFGKGVVFRTTNANAVQITRPLSFGVSLLVMCAAPESNPMERLCTPINSTGFGSKVKTTIPLNTTNATVPHIVTLFGTSPGTAYLDALTPVDTEAPLGVGKHASSHPSIKYPAGGTNLVVNGNMALDNGTTTFWQSVGTPTNNRLSFFPAYLTYTPAYNGTSRSVVINANGQGIESLPINFESGKTYLILARVYNNGNGGTISMDLDTPVGGFVAPAPIAYTEPKDWQSFRVLFTASTTTSARLRFTSTVTAAPFGLREFLVDDVHVYEAGKGSWVTAYNFPAMDNLFTYSTTPGAEINFTFIGTGFSLGMFPDLYGGFVEVCYDDNALLSSPECITLNNNFSYQLPNVTRPFLGLASTPTQFWVRVRDVDNGMTPSVFGVRDVSRSGFYSPARLNLDFVQVFDNTLPPTITDTVTGNEDYKVGGVNALMLLPTANWQRTALTYQSTYTENSFTQIVDSLYKFATSTHAGPAGLMRLDLTQPSTLILYTDFASFAKSDQLIYCVDGHDGRVVFDYATKLYKLDGATKCKMTNQLRTSTQIVLDLPVATANSTLTFYTLTPSSFLIDGFQFLKGVVLAAGYYETNLSFGAIGGGDGDQIFEVDNPSYWRTDTINSWAYSGGSALVLEDDTPASIFTLTNPRVNERLQFRIKDATGFSILTMHGTFGGLYTINVRDTATNGTIYDQTFNMSNHHTFMQTGITIPITGLPLGNYTVTIQNGSNIATAAKQIYLDAIEVYGALKNLGSLYDDNERNTSGEKLITYGPSRSTWTLNESWAASTSMNRTNHTTSRVGALAMFEVGNTTNDATGITIYHNFSSSQEVSVCWKNLATPASAPICLATPLNLLNSNTAGNVRVNFTADGLPGVGVAGNYAVSIINRRQFGTIALDAIQVHKGNNLTEGIYGASALNTLGAFTGSTWTYQAFNDSSNGASTSATLTFTMEGVGFSIVLNEDFFSSQQYTLCVDRVAGGLDCDTIGTAGSPLVINRIASPNGRYALTFMGLHSTSGGNETYTVTLRNNTANTLNPLKVRSVHVMGAKPPANRLTNSTNTAENNDSRVRYLPFGWASETIDRFNPVSGGSQHLGTHRGAVAYVEFQGTHNAMEYIRQISWSYANAEICFGEIGNTATVTASNTTGCIPANNGGGAFYGISQAVSLGAICNTAHGCWVSIRSMGEFTQMPLDLVRFFNASEPLKEGKYEESFAGLRNFNSAGTLFPSTESGTNLNVVPQQAGFSYSGGFARRYTATGANSALNGGMFFTMEGSGFTVSLTKEPHADTARICYLSYTGPEPSVNDVLTTGTCSVVNNEFSFAMYRVNRTFVGLPYGTYAVAVQMLPDDNTPAAHLSFFLPLRMEIDFVQIYGDVWFGATQPNWADNTHTNAITPASGRVETSFARRATEKNFLYYGNWQFNEAAWMTLYSGSNYDYVAAEGAAVIFRTSGANAAQIFVQLGYFNSPIRVCATPLNLNPLVASGATNCNTFDLTGFGYQQPLTFQFGGGIDEYLVSVYTVNERPFYLDAVQVYDTTAPLTAGKYEDNDPRIFYPAFQNAVPNGNMEIDGQWSNVGSPSTNALGFVYADGFRSRYVIGAANTGIQSQTFSLNPSATTTYTVTAKVYMMSGSAQMRVNNLAGFTNTTVGTPLYQWHTIRQEITLAAGSYPNINIQFVASGGAASFYVDSVQVSTGGTWRRDAMWNYSGGTASVSTTTGASVNFMFEGTGFELGMPMNIYSGEAEVCYGIGSPTTCFTYQQEAFSGALTSRVVAGLPYGVYQVRIRDVEDGKTTTIYAQPNFNRYGYASVGQIYLDFVRIFNEPVAPTVPPGYYNEDAKNGSNVPYLQLYPANRWKQFTGFQAFGYSDSSMYGVMTDYGTYQVQETQFAGATAVLNVPVVNGEGVSVILFSKSSFINSTMVLVCAGDTISGKIAWNGINFSLQDSTNCVLKTGLRTDNQITVDGIDLPELSASASTGTKRVMFTTLNSGYFNIDGFQIIKGTSLSAGIHDETLPDSLLNFDAPPSQTQINRTPFTCVPANGWCVESSFSAVGGMHASTARSGATLNFVAEGTGFSIITTPYFAGIDFRICYKKASNSTPFPDSTFNVNNPAYRNAINLDGTGESSIWCEIRTNSVSTFGVGKWTDTNSDYFNPSFGNRFGFSFYGLPFDKYAVSIRVVDPIISTFDRLYIDAIAVFGNTNGVLQPGFYDNTVAQISYEPAAMWTNASHFSPPPWGAYNLTEKTTTFAGAIAQFRLNGNAFTLYQPTGYATRDVRICMVLTEATIHCTPEVKTTASTPIKQAHQIGQFSQNGSFSNFTPIMFYGLGDGEHHIILENRDHNRKFGIDAIMVQQ